MSPLLILLSVLAPSPAAAAGDKTDPPALKLSDDEQTILDLTNAERAKEKLPPYKPNALLFQAARAHSANMAKQGKMEHVLDGKTPGQRLDDAGYDYKRYAENIAYGEGVTIRDIMKGWMESKHHHDNILDPDCTEIGVGVAQGDDGKTYYTQDFGISRKKP